MSQKSNPLTALAKIMHPEIDKFANKYDQAEDKDALIHSLGDLHNLSEAQKSTGIYALVTKAVGITDNVYNDSMLHMFHHHSNQNGVNRCGDSDHLRALSDFVVQGYVDVSRLHSKLTCTFEKSKTLKT